MSFASKDFSTLPGLSTGHTTNADKYVFTLPVIHPYALKLTFYPYTAPSNPSSDRCLSKTVSPSRRAMSSRTRPTICPTVRIPLAYPTAFVMHNTNTLYTLYTLFSLQGQVRLHGGHHGLVDHSHRRVVHRSRVPLAHDRPDLRKMECLALQQDDGRPRAPSGCPAVRHRRVGGAIRSTGPTWFGLHHRARLCTYPSTSYPLPTCITLTINPNPNHSGPPIVDASTTSRT